MMEPYLYVITWYPNQDEKLNGEVPCIISHGTLVAFSTLDAYTKMVDLFPKETDLDHEQVEFMVKPFMDGKSCSTKKDIGTTLLYNFYMNNDMFELQSTTYNINDLIKNSFNSQNNYSYSQDLPNVMMMIDVLALLNNDKTL